VNRLFREGGTSRKKGRRWSPFLEELTISIRQKKRGKKPIIFPDVIRPERRERETFPRRFQSFGDSLAKQGGEKREEESRPDSPHRVREKGAIGDSVFHTKGFNEDFQFLSLENPKSPFPPLGKRKGKREVGSRVRPNRKKRKEGKTLFSTSSG